MSDKTIADRLHDSFRVQWKVEEEIFDLFEKHEPEVYEKLEFSIGSDDYDNSIEIYFKNPLPYPYEPCAEIRQAIYDMGFSIVYWNFMDDKNETGWHDEIRGYEPRHCRDSATWKPCKYGYVDDRFNESEWLSKYNFKNGCCR